jgi:sugar phosphate isomerase/epimerase
MPGPACSTGRPGEGEATMSLDTSDAAEVTEPRRLSRRLFLGAGVGAAGAAAFGGFPSAAVAAGGGDSRSNDASKGTGGGRRGRIVPRGRLGIQHWSVRDAVPRLNKSVSGYLGGPNFPDDPTDLGPLVPLPGGFGAVFEYLASVGYAGFEFFQLTQGANGVITPQEIRGALDRAGLVAAGAHMGSLLLMVDPVYRQGQIELAHILGHRMIGTAGDPLPTTGGNPPSGLLADWEAAAANANMVGAALRAVGLKYFFHPEQHWFRFFTDPAHPELDRVHRIDWFTDHTDPRYVFFEPDTMHTLAGRARFVDPVDGRLFDHNAWFARLSASKRLIAWHIKDAVRITPMVAPGVNPFSQNVMRPGFFANPDVVYVGEGSIGRGYPVDPDPQVLGFRETLSRFRLSEPGWFINESDNSPGPAEDPGRSLRWAKVSARYTLNLEFAVHEQCLNPSMQHV